MTLHSFQMLLRSSNAVGYTNYPDNVIYKFVDEAAKGGIDLFRVFDCLNNTKGLSVPVDAVLKTGKLCEATMCYTGDIEDPKRDKYGLKYYVSVAKELEKMGTHILGIKDMAGLIKPYAATKLIKTLKEEIGIPIQLHTHDTSGNGVATLLRAADAGVDIVDTAISAVSGVTSQPSLNAVVAALAGQERDTGIDINGLNPLANYWEVVRTYYSGFESDLKTGTAEVYYNEIPGGQYSNFKPQVAGLGLIDKWEECKKMYHDVNDLFGDVIKVTPSSKIVADMAMFLVQNNLTTKDVIAKADELTFPQSVIDFMKGMVGQPYQGFPKDVQKAILKGEEPIDCRPGELLEPIDLDATKKTVEDAIERPIDDQQLMSYVMYPHVYMDYIKHRKNCFDVSLLPTPVFLYGLEPGQEITVCLDEGKTLIIKLISVGSLRSDGTRTVYFELNGLQRTVSVRDNSAQTTVKERVKADKFNKHQIGAPMPGKVFKIVAKPGEDVKAGDVIIVTEAMKMETNIKAPIDGKVKEVLYSVGEAIEKDDLLDTLSRISLKTGDMFFFIIDEWDAICREYPGDSPTMKRFVDWLRRLFKSEQGMSTFIGVYMTGILPIKKYKTQSALNNFIEYSVITPRRMARFFGFTGNEVKQLSLKYGMPYDVLEKWYDGYKIGNEPSMFNPNSVMQALSADWCTSYWGKTATYDVIVPYVKMNFDGLKDDILNMLAGGRCHVNPAGFQNDLALVESKDDALTVLIHLGYLSYDRDTEECFIPNLEVSLEMELAVKAAWPYLGEALEKSRKLLEKTLAGDENAVATGIDLAHDEHTSILSYNDENSLACVLSIAYYYARNNYVMLREFASGKGFADLVLIPRKNVAGPALLIELKYNKDADTALNQIKRQDYPARLEDWKGNLLLVGINYDKASKTHSCRIERG